MLVKPRDPFAKAVRTDPMFRQRVVKSKKCFKRHEKHRTDRAQTA
jgi:stalled ribosome alternative rescue factor ArfA